MQNDSPEDPGCSARGGFGITRTGSVMAFRLLLSSVCYLAWPVVASLQAGGIFTMWLTFSNFVMARFTKLSKNPSWA